MKIPIFHNNGIPFNRVKVQVFIERPTKPIDWNPYRESFGYSIQLNASNPFIELSPETNTWVPRNPNDQTEMLAFQQNVLQISQGGIDKFGSRQDFLVWNRNSIQNAQNIAGVEFGATIMPFPIWESYQHFGEKQMQTVELESTPLGMSIKLYDNMEVDPARIGLKIIYKAEGFPQRKNPNAGTPYTSFMDVPMTPFTFFQVRIVGYGDLSHSIFPSDASFGINIECDDDFQFNLIDSDKDIFANMEAYKVNGVSGLPLFTGESSNLTCTLSDNGWRAKQLYYRCFV